MTRKSAEESPLDDALLGRFVSDECTAAERAHVVAWIGAHPDRARTIERLRMARRQFADGVAETMIDVDLAWTTTRGRLSAGDVGITRPRKSAPRQHRAKWIPRNIAAIAVATAAVAGIAVLARSSTFDRHTPVAAQTYVTAASQRKTVLLSDGTHVTLAPNTTLTIAANFGADVRRLTLTGEAYFDVVHAAGTPFVVQAGRTETRVAGTMFSVRRYAHEAAVRVAVVTEKSSSPVRRTLLYRWSRGTSGR